MSSTRTHTSMDDWVGNASKVRGSASRLFSVSRKPLLTLNHRVARTTSQLLSRTHIHHLCTRLIYYCIKCAKVSVPGTIESMGYTPVTIPSQGVFPDAVIKPSESHAEISADGFVLHLPYTPNTVHHLNDGWTSGSCWWTCCSRPI